MKKNIFLAVFFIGLILSVQNLLPPLETKNVNSGTNNGLISKPNTSGILVEDSSEFSEGTMENLTISDYGYLMLDSEFPAQPNWINMAPSNKPGARRYYSMAYNSKHNKVILFGGDDGTQDDETWAYDLETNMWAKMAPSTKPSARERHSMVYDLKHDKVILFGGWDGSFDDETWAYDLDTNTWTNMAPSNKPGAREFHSMVYDSEHDKVILFGGWDVSRDDETWAYDFDTNTWTNMAPSNKPGARQLHSMVYDSEHDKVILFGGEDIGGDDDETWAYDLDTNNWANMAPSNKPGARDDHSMVYDSEHDKIILFGGFPFNDQTWTYDLDTNTWTNMNPSTKPSARFGHSMAYDLRHDKVILFGGWDGGADDETWVFRLSDYQQTGKFDSKITSLGGIHKFSGEISWSPENQTVGTNLTVQIGFSNTKNDEDFTYTSPENTSFTFEGVAHYFRYRVNFESTNDLVFSPMLENVMIDYIVEIESSQTIIYSSIDESKGDTISREENSLAMVMLVGLIGVISVLVIFAILSRRRFKTLEAQVKSAGKGLKSKSMDKFKKE